MKFWKAKGGKVWLWLAPLLFIMAMAFVGNLRYPVWMDEYVFYRLSSNIPDYSSTTDWFYEDRPEVMNSSMDWERLGFDYEKALSLTYDTEIFQHSPLPVYLVYPVVKGLNVLADNEVIPHIEEQPGAYPIEYTEDGKIADPVQVQQNILKQHAETMTIILRCIPLTLFFLAMWLIYKMMTKKVGLNAMLFIIPVAVSPTALSGSYMFYWDAFMFFFFVLTLYLMETRPNGKWQYLTACLMINTKMFIPFLLLIPLVIKGLTISKKHGLFMLLTGLSILPFYFAQVIVTGDLFYSFNHYLEGLWITKFMYQLIQVSGMFGFETIAYILMVLPIILYPRIGLQRKPFRIQFKGWAFPCKKYPAYAVLCFLGLLYAFGSGLGVTHLSTLLYIGALIFPLVGGEWHLMERAQKWIGIKKPIQVG